MNNIGGLREERVGGGRGLGLVQVSSKEREGVQLDRALVYRSKEKAVMLKVPDQHDHTPDVRYTPEIVVDLRTSFTYINTLIMDHIN